MSSANLRHLVRPPMLQKMGGGRITLMENDYDRGVGISEREGELQMKTTVNHIIPPPRLNFAAWLLLIFKANPKKAPKTASHYLPN